MKFIGLAINGGMVGFLTSNAFPGDWVVLGICVAITAVANVLISIGD